LRPAFSASALTPSTHSHIPLAQDHLAAALWLSGQDRLNAGKQNDGGYL
jgi:hypothetical protein